MSLTFMDYEESAAKTAIYPHSESITYPILGINGEAGEIAEKWKKVLRDQNGGLNFTDSKELRKEIGDVLWYLAALAHDLGYTLEQCAQENLVKLKDREQRGVLSGSGDNR